MKHESVSESARRVFPWEKAGMSQTEWRKAVAFDSTDWGWVILSIGMLSVPVLYFYL